MPTSGPGPEVVLDLIEAFRRSKAMFAAVSLGVFDRLHERACTAAELGLELAADTVAVERLLDGCTGLGLLIKDRHEYRNSPAAEAYLRRSSAQTLAGYILYSDVALYPLWGDLDDAVREGSHRWVSVFGGKEAIFANYFGDEKLKRDFLAGMHGMGLLSSPTVVSCFDLSRFRWLVDLGGGTGHLALAALDRYPQLRASVFEIPAAAPVSREYAGDRVDVVEGDFFTEPLPEADLYAVGQILHDWAEDKIHALLRKICDSLPAGGALLIAEKLLDEDKTGPVSVLMQSLNMLVCTDGRERTLSEYAALLRAAGFSSVEGKRTGKPLDAIFAVK